MKRILILVFSLLASMLAFGSEGLDVYTYLYRHAVSPAERLAVLRDVSDARLAGAGQLYAEALSQLLLEYPSVRSNAEREMAEQSARLLAGLLGDEKYAVAAADLWRTVEVFQNPLVKADALIALGRIRSLEYLEHVVRTLNDMNLHPGPDPEAGSRIAYGAILSLEKYQDPAGYIPVFLAANSWYPGRVKEQAHAALPYIASDPSGPISSIIRSSTYTFDIKLTALQRLEESNAASDAKANVAAIALAEGWRSVSREIPRQMQLANIRKLSIDMLRRYGSSDPAVIVSLDRSMKDGIDMEERLNAIAALSAISSEDSVRALSLFLANLNTKRRDGNITQNDERLVRAVIPALGATGQVSARPALQSVEYSDWTNTVKNLALEALRRL